MYNFDPYNVLLSIATNIPVLLMTAFVLQGHICVVLLMEMFIISCMFIVISLYDCRHSAKSERLTI